METTIDYNWDKNALPYDVKLHASCLKAGIRCFIKWGNIDLAEGVKAELKSLTKFYNLK